MLDDHRALEPPDPIPNSEVKRCIADGSVGFPHVRVGHRQAYTAKPQISDGSGVFLCVKENLYWRIQSVLKNSNFDDAEIEFVLIKKV